MEAALSLGGEIGAISVALGRGGCEATAAATTGDDNEDGADDDDGRNDGMARAKKEELGESPSDDGGDAKVGATGHSAGRKSGRSKRDPAAQGGGLRLPAQGHEERLAGIMAEESELPPWWKVGAVAAIFVLVMALTISRGFMECGSVGFFLVVFFNLPIVVWRWCLTRP